MKKGFLVLLVLSCTALSAQGSKGYWQQHADYTMQLNMDTDTYRYSGTQKLVYKNNSADTLYKVFYHLYPNAFQPGSEMDARLQHIADPDGRMVKKIQTDAGIIKESRIKTLKPDEIGYLRITNFRQDGVPATTKTVGTVFEVTLAKPLLPNRKTTFTLGFEGQVPVQIRRSGRNNAEGVALSMSQWYPKIAEFDFEGWHADPYIGREFHGVWSNFDVKITIDKDYILGGTGYLQNADKIGYGYEKPGKKIKRDPAAKTLTWHFKAPMVHDFTWAADKDYRHDMIQVPDGPMLHFLYKNNPKIIDNWKKLQPAAVKLMQYNNATIGAYPYKQYSIIQGGDGGMEYAMCTLLLGNGTYEGILGTMAHEMAHAWFQHTLATNESRHGWMDEGFASYLEDIGLNAISDTPKPNPFVGSYLGYISMANSGKELPQTTHADRFDENRVYSITSYSKGELFLAQLDYLIGHPNVIKTLQRYYSEFKFRHPTPTDIIRTAERVSGAQLGWYLTDWTRTTNTIDYAIRNVTTDGSRTTVSLERIGRMPMPVELQVKYTDGSIEHFHIPLRMMHYTKPDATPGIKRTVLADWAWAFRDYQFGFDTAGRTISSITIDPGERMADVKRDNNSYTKP